MDFIFTLISTEGIRFDIEHHLLVGNSVTFAELLGSGVEDARPECKLEEKAEEVKLLVDIFQGERTARFSVSELHIVKELARKYQSGLLQSVLRAELLWYSQKQPYEAFVIAFGSDDLILGERLARIRVAKGCVNDGKAGEWDQRYMAFRKLHLSAFRHCLTEEFLKYKSKNGTPDKLLVAFGMAICAAQPEGFPGQLLKEFIAKQSTWMNDEKYMNAMDEMYEKEIAKLVF